MTRKSWFSAAALSLLLIGFGCTQEWPTDPPDVARPGIASIAPADAALMVPTSTRIALTFTEAMDIATLSACAEVRTGGGTLVPGAWSGADHTYTFTPTAAFAGTTHYSVEVKGAFDDTGNWLGPAARDEHGNSLGTAFHAGFTTAGAYGGTTLYMGKSDVWGESGGEVGLGVVKDFAYHTSGAYAGEGEVGLALTPSRQELYVADANGHTVDVLNPASAALLGTITLPDTADGPGYVAFTPNGSEAWILCRGRSLAVVVQTSTRQVTHVLDLSQDVNGGWLAAMTINHAGTRGYITTGGGYSLIVVDVATKQTITTVSGLVKNGDPWAKVEGVEVTPDDGKVIVACDYAMPQLAVVNAATNTVEQDLFLDALYNSDSFIQAKGNFLYVLGRWGLGLMKVDLTTLAVVDTNAALTTEGNTYGWMIGMTAGDDGVVYALTYDGQLMLLKQTDLSLLATIPAAIRKNLVAY